MPRRRRAEGPEHRDVLVVVAVRVVVVALRARVEVARVLFVLQLRHELGLLTQQRVEVEQREEWVCCDLSGSTWKGRRNLRRQFAKITLLGSS